MSLAEIALVMERQHGPAYAKRWLAKQQSQIDVSKTPLKAAEKPHTAFEVHSSHSRATELLAPFKTVLGPAYETIHAIARWSVENSSKDDPAPHLLTTYWTLEEITGKSERTLIRHLVEPQHSWSKTVKQLIDIKHNYGERYEGERVIPCIVGTIIRFFPEGRKSPNAKVKKWAERNLIKEADAGRTRPSRHTNKPRYQRQHPQMSVYRSVKEQMRTFNWLLVKIGQSVSNLVEPEDKFGSLYADIPRNHVLNALRTDLKLAVDMAIEKGRSVTRTRARWVDLAAQVLAKRFQDHLPQKTFVSSSKADQLAMEGQAIGYTQQAGRFYRVYADGFTNLWRRALWTAIRAELYGGLTKGWMLLEKMSAYAQDAFYEGKHKPSAWAWTLIKQEGFTELLRDYPTGTVKM